MQIASSSFKDQPVWCQGYFFKFFHRLLTFITDMDIANGTKYLKIDRVKFVEDSL